MPNETFLAKRLAIGLTQIELSKILRLSERQIARYDNEQSKPPGPVMIILDGLLTGKWPGRRRKKTAHGA